MTGLEDKNIMQPGVDYRTVFYRDGKLNLIIGEGLLVMKAWPPRAWYRASRDAPWQHLRPEAFDLNMAEPLRRIRRAQRRTSPKLWALYEQYGAEARTLLDNWATSVRQEAVEAVGVILDRLAGNAYQAMPRTDDLVRIAAMLKPHLPWFSRLDRERQAFETFYEVIPREVHEAVEPFPERHYSLVSFCARCPGGLDLLRSTPALALMLANCRAFGRRVQRPLRSCRALLRKTQRMQLEWLGFPDPGKSTIRVLRKVPTACCTVRLLLYLRQALRDKEARKLLEHLPRINRGVVRIVSDPKLLPHATYSLLEEVGQCPREDLRAPLGHRMAKMLPLLKEKDDFAFDRTRFHSMHSFTTFTELADTMGWDLLLRRYPIDFPKPPFPGNHWLHPIVSPRELVREGMTQRHCIASKANRIIEGHAYAYRVLLPGQRATLLLHREDLRQLWAFSDCRAAGNGVVEATVRQRIQLWIHGHQAVQGPETPWDELGQMLFPWPG